MEKVVKFIQSIGTRFLNSISNFFDFSEQYIIEDNIKELFYELCKLNSVKYFGGSKLNLVNSFLYDNILDSTRKYPKEIEKIRKGYRYQIPSIFEFGCRYLLKQETYNAKKVAEIILDILYLNKDELDKIDGGLPVA